MAEQPVAQSSSAGRLSYQPAPDDRLVPRTLEFIRAQLAAWRNDPRRPKVTSEKQLNSSLCVFLNNRSRSFFPMVQFAHEFPQTGARTVDMGVLEIEDVTCVEASTYTNYEPFMVVEAKRLPAPSKDREREYVTGQDRGSGAATGGIQRFKLGLHGAKVEVAIIVGYIEKETASHWHTAINGWISELVGKVGSDGCVWSEADALGPLDCARDSSSAESNHQRSRVSVSDSIKVHHLWIVMAAGG